MSFITFAGVLSVPTIAGIEIVREETPAALVTNTYRGDGLRHSKTAGGVTTTYTWDVAAGLPVVLQDGANT